jgi:hypothetical protein
VTALSVSTAYLGSDRNRVNATYRVHYGRCVRSVLSCIYLQQGFLRRMGPVYVLWTRTYSTTGQRVLMPIRACRPGRLWLIWMFVLPSRSSSKSQNFPLPTASSSNINCVKPWVRPQFQGYAVIFRDYGGKQRFSGRAITIQCLETNQILRDVSTFEALITRNHSQAAFLRCSI